MDAGLRALVASALVVGAQARVRADEPLPAAPSSYFNDYAGLVAAVDEQRVEAKLRAFDEQTSSQVLVAIFPELPSPSLEDFTVRVAESWKAGRKELDNGAVLFLFVKERKLRIEVGYGLEGALPDALARRILDEQVVPRFRVGDWAGGIEAGVDSILAATRGEYAEAPKRRRSGDPRFVLLLFVALVVLFLLLAARRSPLPSSGRTYGGGWRSGGDRWSGGGSGGGSSGGGGSSSAGGFSAGGGSFGGGGASSSW